MQITEQSQGIPTTQTLRYSTKIINRSIRGGNQQYWDRGFGKMQNTDFEPLHYRDT
ncbi:MAG: hypothetical protein IKI88_03855 [Anaerotignum sp.]|nr:hypothetical protein [Anaerotignum sp.]